jgi:phosphatidylserine/phosphatidylglycerophosphate/cardiolipin synthase-like enzyme
MHISLAVFADGANLSQEGKLNVLGVFDALQVVGFPAIHPRTHFVVRLKGSIEGVAVRPLTGFRLHVRAIIRDGTRAFVGSQSLRTLELDERRELGLLINNPSVTRQLLHVFEADWGVHEGTP